MWMGGPQSTSGAAAVDNGDAKACDGGVSSGARTTTKGAVSGTIVPDTAPFTTAIAGGETRGEGQSTRFVSSPRLSSKLTPRSS